MTLASAIAVDAVLADLAAAFGLLTRIPTGHAARAPESRETWAYPVVGIVLGAACAVVYALARRAGIPIPLAAIWSAATGIFLTGALHEDGLADVADGMGGGTTRARKLEIMRDSRIGTYGALALLISLAVRVTAIASLGNPLSVAAGLIVSATTGRAAIVALLIMLSPARGDGMAAGLGRQIPAAALVGFAITLVTTFACLPPIVAVSVIVAVTVVAVAFAALARAQLGGHTGDVLGAGEQITECVAITTIVAMLAS